MPGSAQTPGRCMTKETQPDPANRKMPVTLVVRLLCLVCPKPRFSEPKNPPRWQTCVARRHPSGLCSVGGAPEHNSVLVFAWLHATARMLSFFFSLFLFRDFPWEQILGGPWSSFTFQEMKLTVLSDQTFLCSFKKTANRSFCDLIHSFLKLDQLAWYLKSPRGFQALWAHDTTFCVAPGVWSHTLAGLSWHDSAYAAKFLASWACQEKFAFSLLRLSPRQRFLSSTQ